MTCLIIGLTICAICTLIVVRLISRAPIWPGMVLLMTVTAYGDAFDEVNAQRANFGLPPLVEDPHLTDCAQVKAEYLAAHQIRGPMGWKGRRYHGHEGPLMGVGYVEGCGMMEPNAGWATCAMRTNGSLKAGAGVAVNGDGLRYMCLIIEVGTTTTTNGQWTTTRNKDPGEGGRSAPLIDTSHLTPNPVKVAVVTRNRIRPGQFFTGKLRQLGWARYKKRSARIIPAPVPPKPR